MGFIRALCGVVAVFSVSPVIELLVLSAVVGTGAIFAFLFIV